MNQNDPTPLPFRPIEEHRRDAERLATIFRGSLLYCGFQIVDATGDLETLQMVRYPPDRRHECFVSALQHHLAGHILLRAFPMVFAKTCWAAGVIPGGGSVARLMMFVIRLYGQEAILTSGWPGDHILYLLFAHRVPQSRARLFIERVAAEIGITVYAYPTRRVYALGWQLGVPLPYCGGRCPMLDPLTLKPRSLQYMLGHYVQNPIPPRLKRASRRTSGHGGNHEMGAVSHASRN
jgi:hypothetical protein